MTLRHAFPGPSGTSTTESRQGLAGLVVRDTSGNARAGIFPRHTNALVTARSDMNVDVAAFEGITVRGGGPLFMANDGTSQVAIATAPGSNQRLDVVYYKQDENASPYADGDTNPILASQLGPVSPSPTLAATLVLLPVGAVPLASVLMPAGKTATNQSGVVITPINAYTAAAGGPIWARTLSDLQAISGYAFGTTALVFADSVAANNAEYFFNGTAWIGRGVWVSFTPSWTGAGSNPSIGNGSLVARYAWLGGKSYALRYSISVGSTTNGGGGIWSIGLPPGIATPAAGGEQDLLVKAYLAGPAQNYAGTAIIGAGGTGFNVLLPGSSTTSALSNAQNANNAGATGTGVPLVAGAYSFANGSNLVVNGTIEAA
jgi:hypothetical protein